MGLPTTSLTSVSPWYSITTKRSGSTCVRGARDHALVFVRSCTGNTRSSIDASVRIADQFVGLVLRATQADREGPKSTANAFHWSVFAAALSAAVPFSMPKIVRQYFSPALTSRSVSSLSWV